MSGLIEITKASIASKDKASEINTGVENARYEAQVTEETAKSPLLQRTSMSSK